MNKNTNFWQDKCVVITGASSGIGKALAEYLAGQGARLGLIARDKDKLRQLVAALPAPANNLAWADVDVTDPTAMSIALRMLEQHIGPCMVLIANAGIYHKTDVVYFDAVKQNQVIATNVQGVINSVGAVLPGMIARRQGHIVAVSSIAGMIGLPAAAAYSASKAALVTYFQSLRVDLHPLGVKATVVAPGFVDTPMITDEERQTLKDLLTAELAAVRICTAIQRNRAIDWFPWQTWLVCRLFSLLPSGLYRRIITHIPEMEETNTKRTAL
jgi:short-subunit dehydrogenase